MKYILILLFLVSGNCFAQTDSSLVNDLLQNDSPIFFPNTLSTHPLGILMSRMNHNFQLKPPIKKSFSVYISNGNVWLPQVKGYMPLNESDKKNLAAYVWHKRHWHFDELNSPSKFIELHADAIIRLYQIRLDIPISQKQELKINTRFFSLDAGKFPLSFVTNDAFIEWIHSNIANDDDCFARKCYGLNKTRISYTDQFGKTMILGRGNQLFSGIEFSYFYYPNIKSLNEKNIHLTIGLQSGFNINEINPSMDFGINASINKQFLFRKHDKMLIGLSAGALQQKVLMFRPGIELSSNPYLYSAELLFCYQKQMNRNWNFAIGTTYFKQSAYNNIDDFNSMVMKGEKISSHWHYSISHLFKTLTCNNFFISMSKGKYSFSAYLREDFRVDNAPDIQTGLGFNLIY